MKRGLNVLAKSFGPLQPAQAEVGRNFSPSLNLARQRAYHSSPHSAIG